MDDILSKAIKCVRESEAAWCRFITGNDTGATGSHQAGFYVPKCASKLLFDTPGVKGENKEKNVKILWQDSFFTESCMKYYGQGTRNEYRITRFGRGFPFLQDENIGDLLIIAKFSEEDYVGYVLSSEDDINEFMAVFSLSPTGTNQLIDVVRSTPPDVKLQILFERFASEYTDFPDTSVMASGARECYRKAHRCLDSMIEDRPDEIIVEWINTEYELFRFMEGRLYADVTQRPFDSVDAFIQRANQILNRRKSRAGKSLENHLATIFAHHGLKFEEQVVTEDNKKPDFIFPNGESYHNIYFPTELLTILGVKTTCKDRWRQVLTEADRVDVKYLFTLQPGISSNQLREMRDSKLVLVVPKQNITTFPLEYQRDIKDLSCFIEIVKNRQRLMPKQFFMRR